MILTGYDDTKTLGQLITRLKKKLKASDYKVGSTMKDDSWCLSEFVTNEKNIVAIQSALLLHNLKPNGNSYESGAGILQPKQTIRLHVLTRQACDRDKDGNDLEKHPLEDDCIPFEEKPKKGDVIRVKGNMYTECPDTGESMRDPAVRLERTRQGLDNYFYTEYIVDGDECITCSLPHAFELLKKRGLRMVSPQWKKLNSNVRDAQGRLDKKQRKITNWHYEEVDDSFKIKKRATKKEEPDTGSTVQDVTPPDLVE